VLLCFRLVRSEGFNKNWDLGSLKISPSIRIFTYEAKQTLDPTTWRSRQDKSPCLSTKYLKVRSKSLRRVGDWYRQQRAQGAGWGSGHPRLAKGGQDGEGCQRARLVGASPLSRSLWNPGAVLTPKYQFNKTKQHTHSKTYTHTHTFSKGDQV